MTKRVIGRICQPIFRTLYFLLLSSFLYTHSTGQNIGFEYGTRVRVDFKKGSFQPYSIPFDIPFVVFGPIPKEVKKVTLVITKKNRCGSDELVPNPNGGVWERNAFNSSLDSAVVDTFSIYAGPLQAIQNYKFKFSFVRSVSAPESKDFNQLLKPYIQKRLGNIYKSSSATLPNQLMDPSSRELRAFASEIGHMIFQYYSDRNIPIDEGATTALVLHYLPVFTGRNFFDVMSDGVSAREKITRSMEAAQNRYLAAIGNDAVLRLLIAQKDTLKLSGDEQNMIANLFQNQASLLDAIYARPAPGVNIEDAKTSTDLQPFLAASDTIRNRTATLAAIFVRIDDNPKLKPLMEGLMGRQQFADYKSLTESFREVMLTIAAQVSDYLDKTKLYEAALTDAKFDFRTNFPLSLSLPGTSTAEFVTRGEWYITADLGMAFVLLNPNNLIRPYLGVNFNFFPINRQANYSLVKFIGTKDYRDILKGMSAVVGLSVLSFGSKDPYADLFGATSLLTGLGFRLTDGVRFSYGRFWMYEKDPNPLLNRKTLTTAPYFSLSLDWDLRNWLKNFRKQVPGWAD